MQSELILFLFFLTNGVLLQPVEEATKVPLPVQSDLVVSEVPTDYIELDEVQSKLLEQQALLNVDGQGHENESERQARLISLKAGFGIGFEGHGGYGGPYGYGGGYGGPYGYGGGYYRPYNYGGGYGHHHHYHHHGYGHHYGGYHGGYGSGFPY